jgi:hypothetical protein
MSTPQAAKALASTIGAKVTIDRVPQAAHKNIAQRHQALVIRTGNLDRAQRRRRAASSQYVIDSDEWR